jgi:glucose-6-phosphate 1-dehydrogenase
MNTINDIPCIMVIFGGTGDLTHRKLLPAVYNLAHQGQSSEHFTLVGTGRNSKSHDQYRGELLNSLEKYSRFKIEKEIWNKLSEKIFYYRLDFSDLSEYCSLKAFLERLDEKNSTNGNRLFYLSVAPEFFEPIALNLKKSNMVTNAGPWQRLVIEKPFGRDLATAQYLNTTITEVFPEQAIFRIDHYLGKEMLQNMLVIRFGNAMFESIWNSRYIDNIQITTGETVGVETRAAYYETSGAMRDMVQNHMLQLLALVAMEPPANIDARFVRDEKVKLLQSLSKIGPDNIHDNIVRGQYCSNPSNREVVKGYREENDVSAASDTETFVAMRLFVGNFRWGSMPFYLRTGKRMAEKITNIVIEFKSIPEILYFKEFTGMQPNILEIRIQPEEGISFQFNTKKPGTLNEIANVKMDYCQNCTFGVNSPEAYERLLADVLRGDRTLFTSWDEIEASWSFIDNIIESWKDDEHFRLHGYPAGTWGPEEADTLLAKAGHKWWNLRQSGQQTLSASLRDAGTAGSVQVPKI